MRQSETFENGHCVRHTVTKIHHEARRPSRNVQDTLARHVHGGRFQRLKHGLRHALSVSLGVQKGVREHPEYMVENCAGSRKGGSENNNLTMAAGPSNFSIA